MSTILFDYSIRTAGLTDIGKRRKSNQDEVILAPEVGLFGVSDGMGGLQEGAAASAYVRKAMPLLLETCVAELVHYILCVAGLPLLRLWPGFGGAARISERIAEAEAASGARIRRKPPPPAPRSL